MRVHSTEFATLHYGVNNKFHDEFMFSQGII